MNAAQLCPTCSEAHGHLPDCPNYLPPVFDGVTLDGQVNVPDEGIVENVKFAIRQQHPQVWPQPPRPERVCLVGGGPSLAETVTRACKTCLI